MPRVTADITTEKVAESKVFASNDMLQVSKAQAQDNVRVYTTAGVEVYANHSDAASLSVKLPGTGIYIVKVGEKVYKVFNR